MPLAQLLCEGGPKGSPDVLVLANVLSGICLVRTAGGKYELPTRIAVMREEQGLSVAGLRDRDFDDEDSASPSHQPRVWQREWNHKLIHFGWSWERREIENYLIDPTVIAKLSSQNFLKINDYQEILSAAIEQLPYYTAARHALSRLRRRSVLLSNSWGRGGNRDHLFPEEDERTETFCRSALPVQTQKHRQENQVDETELITKFDQLLPHYLPGGLFFAHPLVYFSGKDLLWAMEPALKKQGFQSCMAFRSSIIAGIEKSDQIWTWFTEWSELRNILQNSHMK